MAWLTNEVRRLQRSPPWWQAWETSGAPDARSPLSTYYEDSRGVIQALTVGDKIDEESSAAGFEALVAFGPASADGPYGTGGGFCAGTRHARLTCGGRSVASGVRGADMDVGVTARIWHAAEAYPTVQLLPGRLLTGS